MKIHTREASALEGSEGRHRDARSGGMHTQLSTAGQRNAQSRSATFASAEAVAAALVVSFLAMGPLTCDAGCQSSELLAVVARSCPGFHGTARMSCGERLKSRAV
jgi:hypothetical protein